MKARSAKGVRRELGVVLVSALISDDPVCRASFVFQSLGFQPLVFQPLGFQSFGFQPQRGSLEIRDDEPSNHRHNQQGKTGGVRDSAHRYRADPRAPK